MKRQGRKKSEPSSDLEKERPAESHPLRREDLDPSEVYEKLDIGPGGYALAPSTETRLGVQGILRRKRDGRYSP